MSVYMLHQVLALSCAVLMRPQQHTTTETAALQCFLTPSQRTVQCSFCTGILILFYVFTLHLAIARIALRRFCCCY